MRGHLVAESDFEAVARVYSDALLRCEPPVCAVENELGLARKQAEYRIRVARRIGLLPPTINGRVVSRGADFHNDRVTIVASALGLSPDVVVDWPSAVIGAIASQLDRATT
jgi:hypothetical protein